MTQDRLDLVRELLEIFTMAITIPSIVVTEAIGIYRLCQIYKLQNEADKRDRGV